LHRHDVLTGRHCDSHRRDFSAVLAIDEHVRTVRKRSDVQGLRSRRAGEEREEREQQNGFPKRAPPQVPKRVAHWFNKTKRAAFHFSSSKD